MKCPYKNIECISDVNTSGLPGDIDCSECEYYNNGIRLTGCYKQTAALATSIILLILILIF